MSELNRRSMMKAMAAAAGSLAAASPAFPADERLIAAAKAEGEVVWYTALITNQVVTPLITAFEARYPGVTVSATRQSTSEVVLKVTGEARANRRFVDVIDGGGQMIPPLAGAGLLEAYSPPAAEYYPRRLVSADRRWTALALLYLTAGYNTRMVTKADAPKTFDDLLDPRWKGQIAWTSQPFQSGAPGFIGNVLHTMGKEKGMEYLRKLAAQKIVNLPINQRGVLDAVIAGQYPIALMVFNHHAVISAAQGAPVDWIKLEPLVELPNIISIVRNSPHPNAARLLVDFLSSEEGQQVFARSNYIPANPRIPALTASLKPDAGGFAVTSITPEMADELPGWIKIYEELFK